MEVAIYTCIGLDVLILANVLLVQTMLRKHHDQTSDDSHR